MNRGHQVSVFLIPQVVSVFFLCFDLSESLCVSELKNLLKISNMRWLEGALVQLFLSFIRPYQNSETTTTKSQTVQLQYNAADISFPLIAYLFNPCNVVHCQFLQRALEFFVISCCCFVNNLFLPAGRPLREEQVWKPRKEY